MKINISETEIKKCIIASAEEAYRREIGIRHPNPLRSRLFVSELGKRIFTYYSSNQYMKSSIEIDENNNSISGEWLLDIFITKIKEWSQQSYYY